MSARRIAPVLALAFAISATSAAAQDPAACIRLEAQLLELEQAGPGGSAAAMARYDAAFARQAERLARARERALYAGCVLPGGFLAFEPPRPDFCAQHDAEIARIEANLYRLENQRAQALSLRGPSVGERQRILAALGAQGCGRQYARFAPRHNREQSPFDFFFRDYGRDPYEAAPADRFAGGTYRTLCVRSCDGYYWPISFSTTPGHFARDDQLCRASCPTAKVALYVYRNPGETPHEAISLAGQPYQSTPNAFRYRSEYVSDCSCKTATQTAATPRVLSDARQTPRDHSQPDAAISVPLPRERPGSAPPPAGGIASVTGMEDFGSTSDTVGATPSRGVRIVGPTSPLYRRGGG